jgi:hypothetical protein
LCKDRKTLSELISNKTKLNRSDYTFLYAMWKDPNIYDNFRSIYAINFYVTAFFTLRNWNHEIPVHLCKKCTTYVLLSLSTSDSSYSCYIFCTKEYNVTKSDLIIQQQMLKKEKLFLSHLFTCSLTL